jgi:hypothetical protein
MDKSYEKHINLFGKNTPAQRCQARSKRSQEQCKKAAVRGKDKCRMHGGRSSGPITAEGRKRCAEARTVHGWETRAVRDYRARKFREMKALRRLLYDRT